jgi:hypothetical protein
MAALFSNKLTQISINIEMIRERNKNNEDIENEKFCYRNHSTHGAIN